jgi:uncharacterized protein
MERRAFSLLHVKAADDDAFTIEGIASTPTPDRMGDIVDPLGAKFKLPMPLLWQHDASKPVGHVTFAKPSKDGIPFKASILPPSDFTSTTLRERATEAWESIKTGLVRTVSIGFSALEYSLLKEGGIHFKEWEWLELSLVTIPAQQDAIITTIKTFDQRKAGARPLVMPIRYCENPPPGARSLTSPGATGIQITSRQHPEEG